MKKTRLLLALCVLILATTVFAVDTTRWSIRGTTGSIRSNDYISINGYTNLYRGCQSQGAVYAYDEDGWTRVSYNTRNCDDIVDTPTYTKVTTNAVTYTYYKNTGKVTINKIGTVNVKNLLG